MKAIPVLFFLILCSCSDISRVELIRTWKVKNYTLWEKGVGFLNGVRGVESGHELTLNGDSTFKEQTCGNFFAGNWKVVGDSLILSRDTTWYRNAENYKKLFNNNYDSVAGKISLKRTAFLIKENKLVSIFKGKRYAIQKDGSEIIKKGYSMTILK